MSVRHSEEEDVEAADPEGSFGDYINSLVVLVVLISLIQLYKSLYCPILSDLGMSSICSRTQWSWAMRLESARESLLSRDCTESTWQSEHMVWQSERKKKKMTELLTGKLHSRYDPSQQAWSPSFRCWSKRPPWSSWSQRQVAEIFKLVTVLSVLRLLCSKPIYQWQIFNGSSSQHAVQRSNGSRCLLLIFDAPPPQPSHCPSTLSGARRANKMARQARTRIHDNLQLGISK